MKISFSIGRLAQALLLIFAMSSCVKNEFVVKFDLPSSVNGTYTLLYYASDPKKGWYMENVAMVNGGKEEVKGITRNPAIVYVFNGRHTPAVAFYVERGDEITIKGKSDDPFSWNISGNDLTDKWSEWRMANHEAFAERSYEKINSAVTAFVNKNPSNPLSTILLLEYYDRRADEAGFLKAWDKLKGKALEEKWMDLVARSDMITHSAMAGSEMIPLVVHSFGNGADTLKPGKQPGLLYFWRGSSDSRHDDIAQIRSLSKDYADSSSRIIADICFEPDSTNWRSHLRNDSLEGVIRGWFPRGEADENIRKLAVERTPYFIVYGEDGKIIYRGDESSKALSEFRKIFPVKEK